MSFFDDLKDAVNRLTADDYDIAAVPTKKELFDRIENFTEPIRMATVREVASRYYPTYTEVINYSREEFDLYLAASADGVHDALYQYQWHDGLGCTLPTQKGLEDHARGNGVDPAALGPDPTQVINEIAAESTRQTSDPGLDQVPRWCGRSG
ncbi:hypothetical protein L0U85_19225, partial [Glycomyces sp. L485]|uniref:hypothetical protein n=1 Tax=Glycomyces sp. L485 TaxID=2909235 RepID=UPI001F4AC722